MEIPPANHSSQIWSLCFTRSYVSDYVNMIHMEELRDPLRLTSNTVFRAFFKEKEELLISILQDFLPLPKEYKIATVALMDGEEPPEQLNPEGKTYRLDLKS